ncbi:hypothetical protein NONI108955_01120 [Nocardia ninae]|uniref:Uncharacterized protein n=1 Tax=Nocardia ninae NBRC 108245 TaxID=1210091 RepID=A0A511MDK1_9NOCA|nr:hypothetical protein [Nocardia ninae]GEM38178.1 hypothetical protein NN4_26970 [Nocardia ninae NBRC 108245]
MAREFAKLFLSINGDVDFESLTADAQMFYTRVLLAEPTLSYCGIADWRPNRLVGRASDLTLPRILTAASELERRRYILVDIATEEVLVRSLIRRDNLLRNPKMAAAVTTAYYGAASRTLRAAIVTEIQRVRREHPEYSSWTHKDSAERLGQLLRMPNLDTVGYTNTIQVPDTNTEPVSNTNPITNTGPVHNADPEPVTDTVPGPSEEHQSNNQSKSVPIPSTHTPHPTPSSGGDVTTEAHVAPAGSEPPPRRCPSHRDEPSPPPCRSCGEARKARDAWERAHTNEIRSTVRADRDASHGCRMCDGRWRNPPAELLARHPDPPVVRCDHRTPTSLDHWHTSEEAS